MDSYSQKRKNSIPAKRSSKTHSPAEEVNPLNYEAIGILIVAFGILTALGLYFDTAIGLFGRFIREVLLGLLGLPSFILPPTVIIYGVFVIFRKDHMIARRIACASILLVLISALIQVSTYNREAYLNLPPLDAIVKFYTDGRSILSGGEAFKGGIFGGILSMPFLLVFQQTGTVIILAALCIIDIILLTEISIAGVFKKVVRGLVGLMDGAKTHVNKDNDLDEVDFDGNLSEINSLNHNPLRSKSLDFRIEKTAGWKEIASNDSSGKTRQLPKAAKSTTVLAQQQIEKPVRMDIPFKSSIQPKSSTAVSNAVDEVKKAPTLNGLGPQPYQYPPISLLEESPDNTRTVKSMRSQALEMAKKLEETLLSFGVEAKVVNISRGPTVTRYELQPSAGVKVSRIVSLADDIALNLAALGVRIEAPIPGKAAIGIEVPNKETAVVTLREIIESEQFKNDKSRLTFAVGKDITGECIVSEIENMPHLLIAGATGSGKSKCLAGIILSIIYKSRPDEVKMILIDPKVVELASYNKIPHLLIPVVTDPKKAAASLNWAVQEMTGRYKSFAEKGARDIKTYNEIMANSGLEKLPQILIVIDELSDLMMVAPAEVEDSICRLAQMARAAGMYLVIATQRPSVDVITGVIKANIPSRIAFAVSSHIDSRTILDMAGAEKLLGKGDMLFYPAGRPKPIRVQGAFASDPEIERVVDFVKTQQVSEYDKGILESIENNNIHSESQSGDNDELLPQAIELVVELGQASVSFIQRKFKVGYARAARIIDQMEARGIVGGFDGSKPRQVLITKQQWYEMKK